MAITEVYYWDSDEDDWSDDPESNVTKVEISDKLFRPKYAKITIADPKNTIQNEGRYTAYQKIRILDTNSNKPIFFGRIEFIKASNSRFGSTLSLQCRDFLSELDEASISKDFSGPNRLGALIKDIVDYYTYAELIYDGKSGGDFVASDYSTTPSGIGNWVKAGTGSGRIVQVVPATSTTGTLVLTDVISAEEFHDNEDIAEYSDAGCTVGTSVVAKCNGALVSNIDTTTGIDVDAGVIEEGTGKEFETASFSPLEAITQLCVSTPEEDVGDPVYTFFLEEGSASSLFPPVFRFFARESRPTSPVSTNGLTVKYEGTNDFDGKERAMFPNYKFPLQFREIYTEVFAIGNSISTDDDGKSTATSLSSSAKTTTTNATPHDLKINKKRLSQPPQASTDPDTAQDSLDAHAGTILDEVAAAAIQRGEVQVIKYPFFSTDAGSTYTVVRTGEMIRIDNSPVEINSATAFDMLVTSIEYEEPLGIASLDLLQTSKGIGLPEYSSSNKTFGTYSPTAPVDTRILPLIADYVPPWSTILPSAIQGYQHDVTFAADDNDTISIIAGDITFYDKETQTINYINSGTDTTYTLPTAVTDLIHYIYFDLGDANPNRLKVTTDYSAAMVASSNPEKMGLMCMVQKASEDNQKATVLPSYGKEPLITADLIDMSGLKEWSDDDGSFRTIQTTQISAGNLKLTADTLYYSDLYDPTKPVMGTKLFPATYIQDAIPTSVNSKELWIDTDDSDKVYISMSAGSNEISATEWVEASTDIANRTTKRAWYEQTGVALDATLGISLYGESGIALRTFATAAAYNTWKAAGNRASTIGVECYVGTDGKIYAGGGTVVLSASGIIIGGTSTIDDVAASTIKSGAASGATANQDDTSTILAGNHTGTLNGLPIVTASNARIVMSSSGITGYNSTGTSNANKNFHLEASSGSVPFTVYGELGAQSGTDSNTNDVSRGIEFINNNNYLAAISATNVDSDLRYDATTHNFFNFGQGGYLNNIYLLELTSSGGSQSYTKIKAESDDLYIQVTGSSDNITLDSTYGNINLIPGNSGIGNDRINFYQEYDGGRIIYVSIRGDAEGSDIEGMHQDYGAYYARHVFPYEFNGDSPTDTDTGGDSTYSIGAINSRFYKGWFDILEARYALIVTDLVLNNTPSEEPNSFDGTRGHWVIQEGADDLYIKNELTGKKYKFKLEEI